MVFPMDRAGVAFTDRGKHVVSILLLAIGGVIVLVLVIVAIVLSLNQKK